MTLEDLETPAAVVDLDRMEANIRRLQDYLDGCGVRNRPHVKTHKIPEIAHLQLQAGAAGITCQKLGEAEVMADSGIPDILIPYNILGAAKLERLASLMQRTRMSVTADSDVTVRGLSKRVESVGELPVLVEFDTGLGRCGVQTPSEAAELAIEIDRLPGLRFLGLMTYPVNERTADFVSEATRLLSGTGSSVKEVSGGGTSCMWEVDRHPELTEYRAGMYIYGDRYTVANGAMSLEQCAFKVLTTVVSRPTAERGILDAGSKTLSSDLIGLEGHGLILEYPDALIHTLSEEHGHVDFSRSESKPEIGERVTVLPNHCCVVSNLFNEIVGHRGGQVEKRFDVSARGTVC